MRALIARFLHLFTSERPLQELRAEFGAYALQAATMDEGEWLAGFTELEGAAAEVWPSRPFVCTAIDTSGGAFIVWDDKSGVPLGRAVASSCAVPGIFPPVTIEGRRYMDGGIGSTTNSTLAVGYDLVLVVALTGGASAAVSAIGDVVRRRFQDEMNTLRSSGSAVEVVRPNEEFVTSIGINLMDFTRRREAAEIGLRQGRQESDRLRSFWS